MELERRTQIRLRKVNGRTGFGSGYLVAPRLVLTAAHILDDGAGTGTLVGTVMVSRPVPPVLTGGPGTPLAADAPGAAPDAGPGPATEEGFPATVRWYRRDGTADAALIELDDDSGWEPPESFQDLKTRAPQRWGQLIGSRYHPVTALGFPRLQQDPESGRRLDEQLEGYVARGTISLVGLYTVSSLVPIPSAVPIAPGSDATPWSGFSGGPLFCGELLIGVVWKNLLASPGTRLTATPTAVLLDDAGFRALIAEHSGWEPLLEPAEPAHLLTEAARTRDLRSPATLLRADAEAVAFRGRTAELERLRGWCREDPASFSVQVITGPGGQGKTRLARELTGELRRKGWVTGDLRSDLTDADLTGSGAADSYGLRALDTSRPLLLVADYAETRPRLVRRLVEHLRRTGHRARLLLLARSDGPWRTDTLGATDAAREILNAAPVSELAPFLSEELPPTERVAAFTDAVSGFGRLLAHVPGLAHGDWGRHARAVEPPADLADGRYRSALTLHMTALGALLDLGPLSLGGAVAGEPPEAVVLRHEERFWEETARAPAFVLQLPTPVLRRAVAVAAACGAADLREAMRTVAHDTGIAPDKVRATAEWLRALYPPGTGRYWGSLHPDRIAEYHARTCSPNPAARCRN